ncbi:LysR family transcriptional regulator [Streptomyces violaceorubidus]
MLGRLAEAADENFVTLEPGYGLRRITDALCKEAGFRPKVVPSRGRRRRRCAGWSRPDSASPCCRRPPSPRPGVAELTVTAPRAAREIGVAWLAGRTDTPPVAAFKKFLLSRRGSLLPS